MAGSYWDRFTAQRVPRRRVLRATGMAGAAAGAVWLVGCGTSKKSTTGGGNTPAARNTPGASVANKGTAPKSGGRYHIGTSVDFDTFDPHISIAGGVAYFPRLYNCLINRSPLDSTFEFDDLAESVEQPDSTTYVFKIRPGVKVAPNQLGVPERDLDGNDVKASFERIKSLPQSNAYAFVGEWVQSVDVSPDGKSITIKTPRPYGFFFWRIGSPINLVVPKELVGQAEKMKSASAGGGPYVLNQGKYTEGQSASLDRSPNYYRKDEKNNNAQLPYIDGLDIKIIADRAARRTALISQQIDEYTAQNIDDSKQLQSQGNYVVTRDPTNTFIAFTMNPTKDPWKDGRIRQAADLVLNRDEYVQRVYKGEAKPNGIIHWSLGNFALPADEVKKFQPYDPQKAKQLIKAATGNGTLKVKVMWPADSTIEEHNLHLPIWLEQMAAGGFEVDKDPQAFPTWLDNYKNLKYDASLALNQVYETPEFEMDFEHSEGPARNHIYTIGIGALYPEIDKAIDDTKAITDPVELPKAVQELQRKIYAKVPAFLPFVTPFSFTLYQSYVRNIPIGLGASDLWLNTRYLDKA